MAKPTGPGRQANFSDSANPSVDMLGLPKSHPRLASWLVIAILSGIILAIAVLVLP